jgi:hypothetical protein
MITFVFKRKLAEPANQPKIGFTAEHRRFESCAAHLDIAEHARVRERLVAVQLTVRHSAILRFGDQQ